MPAFVNNTIAASNSEFDTATYALTTSGASSNPSAMCLSADGTKFYQAVQATGLVTGYDETAGLPSFASTTIGSPDLLGIAASPDGTRIYVTDRGGNQVFVLDPTTLATITTFPVINDPYGIVVTPDNAHVFICQETSNSVIVIETVTFTTTATISVGGNPTNICMNSAGTLAYCSNFTSPSVSVIDAIGHTTITSIPMVGGTLVLNLAITPDDQYVYAVEGSTAVAWQITTASNTLTDTIALTNFSQDLAFTGDSLNVWFTEPTGQIEIYSVPGDVLVHTISGSNYRTLAITPSVAATMQIVMVV